MTDAISSALVASKVFDAGKVQGSAARNLAAVLTYASENGYDVDTIDQLKIDFYAGYMAGACKWTEKVAREWLSDDGIKKRVEKGEAPTPFQKAYGSARVAWSRGRELANLAKLKSATRKPTVKRADSAQINDGEDKISQDDHVGGVEIVKIGAIKDADDLILRLMSVDTYLLKLINVSARLKLGDTGEIIRLAVADFHKIIANLSGEAENEDKIAA